MSILTEAEEYIILIAHVIRNVLIVVDYTREYWLSVTL